MEENEKENIPVIGSLCKCLQWPGLCQAEASRLELLPTLSHACRSPSTWHSLLFSKTHYQGAGSEMEQLRPVFSFLCLMDSVYYETIFTKIIDDLLQ